MSGYMHCATPRGEEEHIRDGESCNVCKDWVRAGRPVTHPAGWIDPKAKKRKVKAGKLTKPVPACGTYEGWRGHRSRHQDPCNPCQQAKYQRDAEKAAAKPKKPKVDPATRIEHGTPKGARQHDYYNIPICDPCKKARSAKLMGLKTVVREHGTTKGARQHRYYKDTMCDPCREAIQKYEREKRDRERAAKGLPPATRRENLGVRVHGSKTGANQHRKFNEELCPPCREAERVASQKRRAAQRTERNALRKLNSEQLDGRVRLQQATVEADTYHPAA